MKENAFYGVSAVIKKLKAHLKTWNTTEIVRLPEQNVEFLNYVSTKLNIPRFSACFFSMTADIKCIYYDST